jgi:hypothetical protein
LLGSGVSLSEARPCSCSYFAFARRVRIWYAVWPFGETFRIQVSVLQRGSSASKGLVQEGEMMGDPGTWDMTLLHSVSGNQRRDEFQGRAVPSFTGDPHLPSSSNDLHCEPPPYSQALCPDMSDSGVLALGTFLRTPDEDGLAQSTRLQHKGSCKVVKESKSKKWSELETSILLQCMVDGDRFCKGKGGAMDWNLICEEINVKKNGGPSRSKEQCQNRFDTLLKAYKDLSAFCVKTGKKFMEVTDDEIRGLKLATPLPKKHEWWYNHLSTIDDRRTCLRGKFEKRQKLNMDGNIGINNSASCEQSLEPRSRIPSNVIGSLESEEASLKQVVSLDSPYVHCKVY